MAQDLSCFEEHSDTSTDNFFPTQNFAQAKPDQGKPLHSQPTQSGHSSRRPDTNPSVSLLNPLPSSSFQSRKEPPPARTHVSCSFLPMLFMTKVPNNSTTLGENELQSASALHVGSHSSRSQIDQEWLKNKGTPICGFSGFHFGNYFHSKIIQTCRSYPLRNHDIFKSEATKFTMKTFEYC